MARGRHVLTFALLAAALVLLHLFHFPGRVDRLLLGWIPWDLAYHVIWMLAATALVFYMTARVWPDRR